MSFGESHVCVCIELLTQANGASYPRYPHPAKRTTCRDGQYHQVAREHVYEQIPQARFRHWDDCHKWAKAQTSLFVEESSAVQQIVRQLMAKHHDPAKPHKGINGADPFVIAMAKDAGADWTVVADEHPGSLENRKIPFVCVQEGMSCTTFQGMMLAEGWKF